MPEAQQGSRRSAFNHHHILTAACLAGLSCGGSAVLHAADMHLSGGMQTPAFEIVRLDETGYHVNAYPSDFTVDVPKFDSGLGTLTGVNYSAQADMNYQFDITLAYGHASHTLSDWAWIDTSWNPGSPS